MSDSAQILLDHYKEALTDEEVAAAFDRHVKIGRGGWADPKLQAVLERVQARLAASQPTPGTDDLGAAWAEAEAALPDKWTISINAGYSILGPAHAYQAGARVHGAQGGIGASGPTPAAALLALAAALGRSGSGGGRG